MQNQESARSATFGRRKIAPRVCIIDSKRHIRSFLNEAFEDLGFVTGECDDSRDLGTVLDDLVPDLITIGLSAGGVDAAEIMHMLAAREFNGNVVFVGAKDSILASALRQTASELGLDLLPMLQTPFGATQLRDSFATLLPAEQPPSPAVDITEALQSGWLELWYQRKIDSHNLVPSGAEAVMRMRHPTWGIVEPAGFIDTGHEMDRLPLADFVIGRVLRDWRYLLERQGPVDLSVNLPAILLTDPDTVQALCQQMPAHPAFGGLLIEIDGSEAIHHLDALLDIARRLGLHNMAISIDNLGTDWPALMNVDGFPFAELKVDRRFVAGCADDRLKQTVCRSIIELARGYGVRTVATGVETRADLLVAHEIGFDLVQGALFGKPTSLKKFARSGLGRPMPGEG
ncbi:EAL domain-containing response regulator [Tardiphaga sp.]|uniref:EAL domain-containing response regulator n=1 Tax=Tardiphaga sp. TaxID=1926292 RepID=UPI0025F78B6A|nr:EAL domain-containing response regulator [Tardiphaga sp.]